jgi:hypothetical protein
LDSLIVNDFPDIFCEYLDERVELLWRGSRDGTNAENSFPLLW